MVRSVRFSEVDGPGTWKRVMATPALLPGSLHNVGALE